MEGEGHEGCLPGVVLEFGFIKFGIFLGSFCFGWSGLEYSPFIFDSPIIQIGWKSFANGKQPGEETMINAYYF